MGYGASAVGVPPPSAPPPATHPLQSSFFPRAVPTALARPAIPSPLPRGLHGGSGSKNPAARRPSRGRVEKDLVERTMVISDS